MMTTATMPMVVVLVVEFVLDQIDRLDRRPIMLAVLPYTTRCKRNAPRKDDARLHREVSITEPAWRLERYWQRKHPPSTTISTAVAVATRELTV